MSNVPISSPSALVSPAFRLLLPKHRACVDFIKSFGIPLLLLGGGGYTIRNVARCWTHETSICLGQDLAPELPYNGGHAPGSHVLAQVSASSPPPLHSIEYYQYFGPDYELYPNIKSTRIDNLNSSEYLRSILEHVEENLRKLQGAPGVQMREIPPSIIQEPAEDKAAAEADVRFPQRCDGVSLPSMRKPPSRSQTFLPSPKTTASKTRIVLLRQSFTRQSEPHKE